MKKNIIIATLVAASALLASISCTKQDDVQSVSEAKVFTATIEQELTKTMLKEDRVFWDEKDLININGARYSATPNRDKPESATFTFVDGIAPTAPYRAIYPASLWDNGKYFFPPVQNYSEGKFNAPMYAESSSEKLTFNNICGVICLRLRSSDNSETVVRRIVLTTKEETVWGEFKAIPNVDEKWEVSVYNNGDQSNTVTLDCGEDGISLNPYDAKEFFIYLPPQHYQSGMTVSIESTNPYCSPYEMHTNYEVSVACNSVYSFDWEVGFECPPYSDYTLPYVFSVGPNDSDTVHFSRGNLQAKCDVFGNFSWKFAENQYDFVGNESGNYKQFNSGTLEAEDVIDLFRWSTENNNYGIGPANNEASFVDWGQTINNGSWRTLSGGEDGEWNYLLTKRVFNGNTGEGYSYEIINDERIAGKWVYGLVIFPDGFTRQDTWKTEFTTWNAIAEAGIAFLPSAGYKYVGGSSSYEENILSYWSCTPKESSNTVYSGFHGANYTWLYLGGSANTERGTFASVRLVSGDFVPAPPEVIEAEEWVESE